MPYSSNQQWLGLGTESVRGTPASTYIYVPVKTPSWGPNPLVLDDRGLRGDMNAVHGQVAGMRYDDFSFEDDVFVDTFPLLVRSALGSADTKTGTTAPYSHVFSLLNTGNGQPPSITIQYFDGLDINQLTASQLDTLNLTWTADGLLSVAPKYVCQAGTIITGVTETYTAEQPVPAWDLVCTLGGTPITKAVSGEIVISRGTKPIPAATGTPNYYQNWAGPLSTDDSKLTVIMESDTELNYFLANTQGQALDLKWTNPAVSTEFITIHYTNVGWTGGKKNNGKEWMEVDLSYRGIPNATDATGGGTSPMKVTIANSVSTTY